MGRWNSGKEIEYRRLRADYDTAFAQLREAEFLRRSEAVQTSGENGGGPIPLWRDGVAVARYRESRQRLMDFLGEVLPLPQEQLRLRSVAGVASIAGTSMQVDGEGFREQVEVLAYRLWEEAGRPEGTPQEFWFRAESLMQAGRDNEQRQFADPVTHSAAA